MKSESFVFSAWMTVTHVCLLAILVTFFAVQVLAKQVAVAWWIGTVIGLADYLIMYFTIKLNAGNSPSKAIAGMHKGWLARLAVITVAVLASLKCGLYAPGVLIAIFAVHIITLLDAIWLAHRREKARTPKNN